MSEFADAILQGAEKIGLIVSAELLEQLEKYRSFLALKNELMNLTAIEGERDCAEKHFLDSLALLGCAELVGRRIIDVGTGAGFPGLPLKLAEPSLGLTLLDSAGKKIVFLKELCALLGVEAECVQGRAEELSLMKEYRGAYDYCASRALARMNVLAELCLPLVKTGGALLAMKARDCLDELKEAEKAVKILGGEVERVYEYSAGPVPRSVVIIRKISDTPPGYPRRYSKIQKSPL